MKNFFYSLALTTAALSITSCSESQDTFEDIIPDEQKEMIAFSTSVEGGTAASSMMTRAGFDGEDTQIAARFVSYNGTSYRHTKTKLEAKKDESANGGTNWNSFSVVDYVDVADRRYWDDAFGRSAQISIYAVAVAKKKDVKNGDNGGQSLYDLLDHSGTSVSNINTIWQTGKETANSIAWQVTGTTQTTDLIASEDLCYSNNIQPEVTLQSGELKYTRGKDGVRKWTSNTGNDYENGYPKYKYEATPTDGDHYPTLDDGTLQFRLTNQSSEAASDGPGHFDRGHMIFHHALTRITINLQKDTSDDGGFFSDKDDFKFDSGDQIHLLKMPYKATLDIKAGKWSSATPKDDIKMATQTAATNMNYTNIAQVIPGFVLNENSTDNVVKFKVSDNTYYITQAQLFKALIEGKVNNTLNTDATDHNGNKYVTATGTTGSRKITLEQGKNYVFTIKVKKTKIQSVTATLVPWIEVTGAMAEAGNNYVKIDLHDKMNDACTHFDLYRMNDDASEIYAPGETVLDGGTEWTKNYNYYGDKGTAETQNYKQKAELTSGDDGVWSTKWFWPSNKSFYHFRTVNTGVKIKGDASTDKDYFDIFSGPVNDYTDTRATIATAINQYNTVNDFHWGAPFTSGASLTYTQDYGWSAQTVSSGQIYPAIGATSMPIHIIEHHMMAKVNFVLHTGRTSTSATELPKDQWVHLKSTTGVTEGTATRVTMTNFAGAGTVLMGSGLVTPSETLISSELPIPGLTLTENSYGTNNVLNSATVSTNYFAKADTVTKAYSYRVVPQKLYRGNSSDAAKANLNNYIGLKFVTADDNQYYVVQKLSEVIASKVTKTTSTKTEQTQGQAIQFWYPGYEYTYHIYINKTGIAAITCTVVDWIKVEGKPFDITLEN